MVRIQQIKRNNSDVFIITLKKSIIDASGWQKGDDIEAIYSDGKVVLRRVL